MKDFETFYYIYLLTCMANCPSLGKFYIGCSTQPEERWKTGYRNNLQLSKDIDKYGWHYFNKQILWKTDRVYDAAVIESFLIDKTGCSHPRIGYNANPFVFKSGSNNTEGFMYGGIPASAYKESRAWDILSEEGKNTNLALFCKEQGIVTSDFFDTHDLT